MTRDEAIALFRECESRRSETRAEALSKGKSAKDADEAAHEAAKSCWNAWVKALIDERNGIEKAGSWSERQEGWHARARVDFRSCIFKADIKKGAGATIAIDTIASKAERDLNSIAGEDFITRFDGYIFPGDADFRHAIFVGEAWFENAIFMRESNFACCDFKRRTLFSYCRFFTGADFAFASFADIASFLYTKFSDDCTFESASFGGQTLFQDVKFDARATFDVASFADAVMFNNACFAADASFDSVTFSSCADFKKVNFLADAEFRHATITGAALFDDVKFSKTTGFVSASFVGEAWFRSAIFEGPCSFDGATFSSGVTFSNAKFGNGGTQDANFTAIKADRAFNLTEASFSSVPNFSQARFTEAPDLDSVSLPLPKALRRGCKQNIVKYRAIRRMAIQSADYEREQMAFKGELRSRRLTIDKWWHLGMWFGLLYDGLSDCGRSIVRPLLLSVALLALFPVIYLSNAGVSPREWQSACDASGIQKWERAVSISLSSGIPIIGGSRTEEAREFQACVVKLGADVPLSLTIFQVVQSLASAVLIFLLLLAIKNRFKIK
jgi:hypothetical protein